MQFIPRLSSTPINNKHCHETRAGLGGWRRHRPARSTSDQIPFQRCPCTELSNRFPLGLFWLPGPPWAQPLLMPSCTYQSCVLSSLTETPSVVAAVAASTCGSRQETDAPAQHSFASLTCSRAFLQPAHVIDTFRSIGDMTRCQGRSRGISQGREMPVLAH